MKSWQIAIIVVIFFALGYFLSDKVLAAETGKQGDSPGDFEPGKSYPDTETGGTIECYLPTPIGIEPADTVFMSNTEPPIAGKLYKSTRKYACYKFPKKS